MDHRKLVNELSKELGREALCNYMQRVNNALDIFPLAFEEGKVNKKLYNNYLVLKEELKAA